MFQNFTYLGIYFMLKSMLFNLRLSCYEMSNRLSNFLMKFITCSLGELFEINLFFIHCKCALVFL